MKRCVMLFLTAGVLCTVSGCGVLADWYHDLLYGRKPVPATPIAPIAKPMPEEYSSADAVALMTDSLIFTLSGLSGKGKPLVRLVGKRNGDALGEEVYRGLVRSRIIRESVSDAQPPGKEELLLYSGPDGNGNWYMVLEKADGSSAYFNQTLKLKKQAAP